jgi:hypothetical protein
MCFLHPRKGASMVATEWCNHAVCRSQSASAKAASGVSDTASEIHSSPMLLESLSLADMPRSVRKKKAA